MILKIFPKKLKGSVVAPESKSLAHRTIICAALSGCESVIAPISGSDDLMATINAVEMLGAKTKLESRTLRITPTKERKADVIDINCSGSGSTLRFLLPVVAALGVRARFDGCERLKERPIADLIESLAKHGVQFTGTKLPFEIAGKLKSGRFEISGDVSSQFVSGLLLALPLLDGDSEVILSSKLESAPYVDLTRDVIARFGGSIVETKIGYKIKGNVRFRGGNFRVSGDWSNAAFFAVAAAAAIGNEIMVFNLDKDSAQGDLRCLQFLDAFGAKCRFENGALKVQGGRLRGIKIDICDNIDLLPIFAVLGAVAEGKTEIVGASRARLKESDRISATCEVLQSLGCVARETLDGMVIWGQKALRGGNVASFGDHRIAMAAAIAATLAEQEVLISDFECVNKSFPNFLDLYKSLGGDFTLEF